MPASGTERGDSFAEVTSMSCKDFDILIFDVDGVLVDVTDSYFAVIQTAIQWVWGFSPGRHADMQAFTREHYHATKRHPAFNDDYDIAWAFLCAALARNRRNLSDAAPTTMEWTRLLECFNGTDPVMWVSQTFGELVGRDEVRSLCEELYLGEKSYREILGRTPRLNDLPGLWKTEKAMIKRNWKDIPLPCGIYTGRPWPEMGLALRILGWEDFPRDRIIVPEDGYSKPDPGGLKVLCDRTKSESPLFMGDTESDRKALRALGRGTFVAIGHILENSSLRFESAEAALEELLAPQ